MTRVRITPKSQIESVKTKIEELPCPSLISALASEDSLKFPKKKDSKDTMSLIDFAKNTIPEIGTGDFESLKENNKKFAKSLAGFSKSISFYRELYALSQADCEISEFDDHDTPPGLISLNFAIDTFDKVPDPSPDPSLPKNCRYSTEKEISSLWKQWKKDEMPIALVVCDPLVKIDDPKLIQLCANLHKKSSHVVVLIDHRESDKPQVLRCMESCSDSEDIDFAIKVLLDETNQKKKINAVGYYLGGCKVGNYLCEKGKRSKLSSAITISSPWDYTTLHSLIAKMVKDEKLSSIDYDSQSLAKVYHSSMLYMHQFDLIETPTVILNAIPKTTVSDYNFLKSPYILMLMLTKKVDNDVVEMWYSEILLKWTDSWDKVDIKTPYDIDGSTPFDSDAEEKANEEKQKEKKKKKESKKRELPDFLKATREKRETDNYDFRSSFVLSPEEQILKEKMDKLELIIYNTLPDEMELKYKSIQSYFKFLTYCLFVEALFEQDICKEIYMKIESPNECSVFGLTQQLFDLYSQPETHHLKKHPFMYGQPIFMMRKESADLKWKRIPEYWVGYVSGSSLVKYDEDGSVITHNTKYAEEDKYGQISMFKIQLYHWNHNKFPTKYSFNDFVIIPGGPILSRIFKAMKEIVNPVFVNLILGQKKIKTFKVTDENPTDNSLNSSQNMALNSALINPVTVIKGPPGSGKTAIISEMILRLLTEEEQGPILIIAASNLAVDNIAEKLLKKKDIITRVCSNIRQKDYGPDHLLGEICLHNKVSKHLSDEIKEIEKRYNNDPKSVNSAEYDLYCENVNSVASKYMNKSKVILSTTATVGSKFISQLKKIPVVIMDEATQSSEPLTLIALGVSGCSKIVLVGDPEQLSVFTKVKNLQMSLFERVLNNGTYTSSHLLDTQYRMHPAISDYPRKVFYEGKLKDGITEKDRLIENIKFPVYFYDHQGEDALDSKIFSSTGEELGFSWANRAEVVYVEKIVEKLIKKYGIAHSDIGVMTGYSAQREFIANSFKRNAIINPKGHKIYSNVDQEDLAKKRNVTVNDINGLIVSSVDAFQGREKKIIVLSCVRSNKDGKIGFMSDRRRMNVAFTRAKCSFILVGNATCLSQDEFWKNYIQSLESKGYVHKSLDKY